MRLLPFGRRGVLEALRSVNVHLHASPLLTFALTLLGVFQSRKIPRNDQKSDLQWNGWLCTVGGWVVDWQHKLEGQGSFPSPFTSRLAGALYT